MPDSNNRPDVGQLWRNWLTETERQRVSDWITPLALQRVCALAGSDRRPRLRVRVKDGHNLP